MRNLKPILIFVLLALPVTAFAIPENSFMKPAEDIKKGSPMPDALAKVATEMAIEFSVSSDIGNDKAIKDVDWVRFNMQEFLANYNWVGIESDGKLKKVIITGKNGVYDGDLGNKPVIQPSYNWYPPCNAYETCPDYSDQMPEGMASEQARMATGWPAP